MVAVRVANVVTTTKIPDPIRVCAALAVPAFVVFAAPSGASSITGDVLPIMGGC
jgi:hypothetical protein